MGNSPAHLGQHEDCHQCYWNLVEVAKAAWEFAREFSPSDWDLWPHQQRLHGALVAKMVGVSEVVAPKGGNKGLGGG